jgi:integrase
MLRGPFYVYVDEAGNHERVLCLLLSDGCLRIGECAGLQWRDIRPSSMWICRNVTTGVLQDSTKSGEDAEVPLTPRLVLALQALKKEDLDRTWVLPRRTKREPEPGGTHSDERYLARIVTHLEADAGLPAHGPHRIRHSRLTHLAEKGLPLRALQHLARHADEETTARYYIHVDKMKMAAMAVDAITAMTEPPMPPGNGLETKRKKSRIALVA